MVRYLMFIIIPVRVIAIAKLSILDILLLTTFILALRAAVVAKLIILGISFLP